MVGDDDRVGAARGGDLRVLGVEDAFQDQLAAPPVLHPLDVLPAERGVELAGDPLRKRGQAAGVRDAAFEIAERLAFSPQDIQCPGWFFQHIQKSSKRQARRNRQAVLQVLVALALDLQVEGQHQRRTLRRTSALDERGGEAAIAHHVELEPERLRDGARDVLDRADRHRREREGDAEALGRARGQHLAVGPVEPGQAGGRERHRHRHVLAHHGGAQRAPIDVDRHALAQRQQLEVGAVGAQGGLVVRAAVDVVEDRLRDALFRELAQVLDVGHHRHGAAFYNARKLWLRPGTSRRTRSR